MAQLLRICFSVILIWSAGFTAAAGQKADPAVFGELPAIQSAEISPNGETVAVLRNENAQTTVVLVDLANSTAEPKAIGVGEIKARSIKWVDDRYLLLLASLTNDTQTKTGMQTLEFFRWIAIDTVELETETLFRKDTSYYIEDSGAIVASALSNPGMAFFKRWTPKARVASSGGSTYASRLSPSYGQGYSVFRVDLKSGKERMVEGGLPETADWIVNINGEPVVRIDAVSAKGVREVHWKKPGSDRFALAQEIPEKRGRGAAIIFHGLTEAENEIYATTYNGGNTVSFVAYNLEQGNISETLFSDENYDLDSVIYDIHPATAVGIRYTDDLPRARYLNPDIQGAQDNLARALKGASPMVVSHSTDNNRMLVRAIYTNRPDDYYVFDRKTRSLSFFASSYPALSEKIYAEKSKFAYAAPDGLRVNGYLTTPVGASRENMPLIVLPHGGPASRDDQSFDWWAFFYAARGYAVYQPNFRGSDGYGLAFREAGYGEWGRKMQDDITNGVQKLIDDGIADPSRICIVGASYGGYAALAGATLTPDLYACAVSVNGVSDLPRMIGEAAVSRNNAAYWERRIGSRFRNADELAAVSPARQAANAGPPVMLIHGKDDTVVPFYQSEIMRDALVAANKPYVFVELRGEDHWLSSGETRTGMLRQSIEFIDRHIGGE
ncbi:MAG: S9 family peptidase [Pseudomonadota bacterium]